MFYELAKTLHIVSMLVWIAGMTVAAVFLRYPNPASLAGVKTFDRRVTTPAMLLTWAFGIFLAVQGGWFSSGWLSVKILLVLLLSGLHGMITGRLRRKQWDANSVPDTVARWVLPVGFGCLIVIVFLVVTKRF